MQELNFKDLFIEAADSPDMVYLNDHKFILALYAIEIIKRIKPTHVTGEIGYMYAINHGELLNNVEVKEDTGSIDKYWWET